MAHADFEGRALEVDPGSHTFVSVGRNGRVEQLVAVKEGAKSEPIAVTIGAAPQAPAPKTEGLTTPPPEPPAKETSTLRHVGYGADS